MGEARLRGVGEHAGSEARIAIQNENLVLFVDGRSEGHGSRSHHESRARHRRANHHRSPALRAAARHHRPSRARSPEDAGGVEGRRTKGVRLSRHRIRSAAILGSARPRDARAGAELKRIRVIHSPISTTSRRPHSRRLRRIEAVRFAPGGRLVEKSADISAQDFGRTAFGVTAKVIGLTRLAFSRSWQPGGRQGRHAKSERGQTLRVDHGDGLRAGAARWRRRRAHRAP